jgi:Cytochrome C oxidase, cbb3-type, subunit III
MNSFRKNISALNQLGFLGGLLAVIILVDSCIHEPFIDPFALNEGQPTTPGCVSDGLVCFESSVLPIFLSSCAKSGCHDAISKKEGYILDNYTNIIRKGISPGNAGNSKLYKVLFASGEDQMPPDVPLSKAQKDSIGAWINQGAKNTVNCNCACDSTKFTYAAIIQPMINNNCVGCHKPGSLGGNIDLSTYTSVKVQVNNGKLLGSVTHAVGYSPMPQGSKLSDCQITQIKNWISAGAPNN